MLPRAEASALLGPAAQVALFAVDLLVDSKAMMLAPPMTSPPREQ